MLDFDQSRKPSARELFALALLAEDFNIHFFADWANRMRPFDSELVELLRALAGEAHQLREMLKSTSRRLFGENLPVLDDEWQNAVGRHISLPEQRYFVVSEREARRVLGVALSLQKNTMHLLNVIDNQLRTEQGGGLLEPTAGFTNAPAPGLSERPAVLSRTFTAS